MKQLLHNKGQGIITWILGVTIASILGLSANQYKLAQDNTETKTEIKAILKEVKSLSLKWDSIIDIKIKPSVLQNNNNRYIKQ